VKDILFGVIFLIKCAKKKGTLFIKIQTKCNTIMWNLEYAMCIWEYINVKNVSKTETVPCPHILCRAKPPQLTHPLPITLTEYYSNLKAVLELRKEHKWSYCMNNAAC
jgi:hypothetical protein